METFDVRFDNADNSNCKGFTLSMKNCMLYIRLFNGSLVSYFEDYKGGVVSIVSNDTGVIVYCEDVKS